MGGAAFGAMIKDKNEAENQMGLAANKSQQAMDAISSVNRPSIQQMQIKLSQLVQQGVLSPEMAETFLQEATAYEQMDPMARNELVSTIEDKGFDAQSRAALNELQGQTAATERGGREAILQNAAARGLSGSGIEMASQMGNQQGSATRMANQGFQAAADANQRQMQAVGALGAMDENKARAQDAINQFNAANRQSVENQNTGWRNDAAAQNLAEKQRIADENVGIKNQQEVYNKGLYQQDFANQMAKGQAFSNSALGAAQGDLGISGQKKQDLASQAQKWSDWNLKEDIKEVDPDEMMDGLKGYSYEYKDGSGMEDGEQVGVMAQDLEKSAPQAVIDTPDGKAIDYSKMGGPVLAALASLDERLQQIEGGSDELA